METPREDKTPRQRLTETLKTLAGLPRVVQLVWAAHPRYTAALVAINALQSLQPVANLWLSKLVIDAVAGALSQRASGSPPVAAAGSGPFGLLGGVLVPDTGYVLALVATGALLTLLTNALDPTATLVQTQLGDHLSREMQGRLLRKANSLKDISYFENPKFYDSFQRAQQDAGYRPLNVLAGSVSMFRTSVQLVSMLAVLFVFQPLLALAALALAVPNLLLQFRTQLDTYAINRWSIPEVRRMRYFTEVLTWRDSAREVRLFDLADYFLTRYAAEFRRFHERFRTLRFRHTRWELAMAALTSLGASGMFAVLGFQALARQLSLGDLSLYSQAVWQTHSQANNLVRQIGNLYGDILFVGQVFEFLDTPPAMTVRPSHEAVPPPLTLRHGIEFRDVTFVYPGTDRPVLRGFSLRIEPGESVAVVGENGAGKTTLVKLLARLYDPTEGQILVDGIDLRDLDLDAWRSRIAAIFQDYSRFHLPAKTNIGLGNLALLSDLETVRRAAERGGATGVIEKLEDGYDTILGRWYTTSSTSRSVVKEGAELSGGEWQKIALSRAFMRVDDPPDGHAPDGHAPVARPVDGQTAPGPAGDLRRTALPVAPASGPDAEGNGAAIDGRAGAQLLILDEPTAALDTQAEYDVYRRFHELTRGRTTILISHRFSTVRMASKIVVLEDGSIVEQGSHDELTARGGVYAELYEKQASRYR